jgi:SprT protein
MQTEVRAEVKKWIEVARAFYPHKTIPMPVVRFSNRMTKVSGRCSYKGYAYELKFSVDIMQRNDMTAYLDRTVPHEVAHLVQHAVYGKMDHKDTFTYVMRNVFLRSSKQATRCHSYETVPTKKRAPQAKYKYECPTCGEVFNLSAVRHGKVRKGTEYSHKGHRPLRYLNEVVHPN